MVCPIYVIIKVNNVNFLALLLRAGYLLIQLGSVPTENVYVILLQNIVDIAVCLAMFGFLGYIFAYGTDAFIGFIGWYVWIGSPKADLDAALVGLYVVDNFTKVLDSLVHQILTSFLFIRLCILM